MPRDDGKAINVSPSKQPVSLLETRPQVASPHAPPRNTLRSEESRRLAARIVDSLRGIGLECELINLDADLTH